MIKLTFLALCLVPFALAQWDNNPILPGVPKFLISGGWPMWCGNEINNEHQCFKDCMKGKEMEVKDIVAALSGTSSCPPVMPGCFLRWKEPSCRCMKQCECQTPHCGNKDCHFCSEWFANE
ncbi:uncharacterized protein LOC116616628 [Nematostella vectensis]|uniref:uncharacterized protein LOC116616628 n=1 Tax=Nematostella vectensis TaxID=45351 RepID=UPI0020772E87|nr:uncharacterized protein LOC116616628 [Nematostella vectensis]